ncbi:MAG: preprotein translocase subunit SecE [Acidobacteria bacterium]|nr:preprotein translocase subunit SecE [Acidobacteriota bacterium]
MRRLQAKEEARAKKQQPTKRKERTGVVQFLQEVRAELRKVTWPSREELATYTIVVFAVSTALTFYIAGLDYVFNSSILSVLRNLG